MGKRGRVFGGRLKAWQAALAHLRAHGWFVLQGMGVCAAGILAVNLPFMPGTGYARGFVTGSLLFGFLGIMVWFTWVTSGLALRMQGAFAEEIVTTAIRKSDHVFDVIASFKFGQRDVDQVVVSRAGVAVVETKWHSQRPTSDGLARDAYQAAANARTVRHLVPTLATTGLPQGLVTAVLVVCGPGRQGITGHSLDTTLGPVKVVNLDDLEDWLARQNRGLVGPDFARLLSTELHELAIERDKSAVQAGPFLRWLARIR